MDIDSVIDEVRAVIDSQLRLAADDEAIAAAGDAILTALTPALKQAGMALAEQAAAEVSAQLPDRKVTITLEQGQPTLVIADAVDSVNVSLDDLGARITVRLPEELKGDLEAAASDLGDSMNTFVVRTLAGKTKGVKRNSRTTFEGTIET